MNRLIERVHPKINKIVLLAFFVICTASAVLADEDIGLVIHSDADGGDIPIAVSTTTSTPLKIRKNNTTYSIQLVDVGNPLATKMRINVPGVGIKAFKRYVASTSSTVVYNWVGGAGSSLLKEVGGWYRDASNNIQRIPYITGENLRDKYNLTATIDQDITGLGNYIKIQAINMCPGTYYWYDDASANSDGKNHLCNHTGDNFTWEDLPSGCHWDCNDIEYSLVIE